MHTEAELREIIAGCCGLAVDDCQPGASIFELGIDSIALASLIAHCEMRLPVEFDDTAIIHLMSAQTIGEIIALLQSQTRKEGGPS